MSLRYKLVFILLIFIIPTIGLMMVFHSRLIESYREQNTIFQIDSTRLIAGSLKDIIFEAHNALHSLRLNNERLENPAECRGMLNQIRKDMTVFYSLTVADMNGNITCSSDNMELPSNISTLSVFQRAKARDGYAVGTISINPTDENVKFSIASPIDDRIGSESVIFGVFDSEHMAAKFESIGLPPQTEIFILTSTGQIIYPPASINNPSNSLIKEKVSKTLPDKGVPTQSVVIRGSDNRERTFRFIPLDIDGEYFVGVGFPEGPFIESANQFVTGNMTVISLLTLAILLLAFGGIQSGVIKPLELIAQTADALASGDLKARTGLGNKKDEIGRLGLIIDNMADALETSRTTLEVETAQKLAYQEKFFRLFEDSILGIFQLDDKSRLVEVNSSLVKMFGYGSEEEMISSVKTPTGSLFIESDDNKKIQQLISGRQSVQMETRFRKKDGTYFYGNLYMWGVWDTLGELEAMEGFVEDITDKKTTRQQLFKLSQAVEQNPIGIIITNGKGLVEYANQGIFNVYGYTPEEFIGRNLIDFVPPSMTPDEVDRMRFALRNGNKYENEVRNFRKDGIPFWERFVISPMNNSLGEVTNTLCLVEDVTEQNRNKDRIFQQVEELSALRTIDLAISSNLDLLATLNIIANLALKHLGVDAVCVLIYDPQFHMMHTAVHYGFQNEPPVDIPFPAAADLSDWELVEEFSIHIPEKLNENRSNHLLLFPVETQFQACFGLPLVAKAEVKGLFQVFQKNPFTPEQHWLDFFYNLATQTAVAMDNYELFRNLKQSNTDLLQAYEATIEGWSKALKYRDQETEDHSVRTTKWTVELAREMGYPSEDLIFIRRGALLHDIGKVAVPDSILNKPGPLTEHEWVHMRKHPVAAYEVLAPIQFLSKSLDIPYCHHERWDGSGYPRGLKGEEIPLAARIFSVIDVYDALTSDRPYRSAWPEEKVISYLHEQSGIQFDPAVVEAFISLIKKQKFKE